MQRRGVGGKAYKKPHGTSLNLIKKLGFLLRILLQRTPAPPFLASHSVTSLVIRICNHSRALTNFRFQIERIHN